MIIKNFNFQNNFYNRSLGFYMGLDLFLCLGKSALQSKGHWLWVDLFSDFTPKWIVLFVIFLLVVPTGMAFNKTDEIELLNETPSMKLHPLPEILYLIFVYYFFINASSFFVSISFLNLN
jgi:hypothetical protein